MYSAFCFIRSLIFTLVMIVATVIWAPICFLFAPLPYNARYRATALWNVFYLGRQSDLRHSLRKRLWEFS